MSTSLNKYKVRNSKICSVKVSTVLLAQYDEALGKLANAEVQVEDLKLQLDDALGAEEMLVQLTERNLELGEVHLHRFFMPFRSSPVSQKIEEMRITIEDLEALKELNDELEENHVETEKQLNEDLQFRELVVQLQKWVYTL